MEFFYEISLDLTDYLRLLSFRQMPQESVPQLPHPVSTTGFKAPRIRRTHRTPPPQVRPRRAPLADDERHRGDKNCPVCLEPILRRPQHICLPCGHQMHGTCAFGLLNLPVLGASAMVRCPLCRAFLDRYDIETMGIPVGPRDLAGVERRCLAVRRLAQPFSATENTKTTEVSALVRRCRGGRASDGFIYNIAILPIERALYHRRNLANQIKDQMRLSPTRDYPIADFVDLALECHVTVLIKTASIHYE